MADSPESSIVLQAARNRKSNLRWQVGWHPFAIPDLTQTLYVTVKKNEIPRMEETPSSYLKTELGSGQLFLALTA